MHDKKGGNLNLTVIADALAQAAACFQLPGSEQAYGMVSQARGFWLHHRPGLTRIAADPPGTRTPTEEPAEIINDAWIRKLWPKLGRHLKDGDDCAAGVALALPEREPGGTHIVVAFGPAVAPMPAQLLEMQRHGTRLAVLDFTPLGSPASLDPAVAPPGHRAVLADWNRPLRLIGGG